MNTAPMFTSKTRWRGRAHSRALIIIIKPMYGHLLLFIQGYQLKLLHQQEPLLKSSGHNSILLYIYFPEVLPKYYQSILHQKATCALMVLLLMQYIFSFIKCNVSHGIKNMFYCIDIWHKAVSTVDICVTVQKFRNTVPWRVINTWPSIRYVFT